MDPKFQSSFIPKRPLTDSPKSLGPVEKNRNIFSILATVIFLITGAVSGGLFAYEKIIEKQIDEANALINETRTAFETDKIKDLIDASARFQSVRGLLDKHFAVSELIVLLQNYTVKNIKFDTLALNVVFNNQGNFIEVSMDGESLSYNAIAKQSELFLSTGFISNVNFSDFSLTENGNVNFRFVGNISPSLISYKEAIKASSPQQ